MAKGIVTVDMNKAKDMYRDTLRAFRQPLLDKLDVDFMRAVESGNTSLQAEISAMKQELRDLPADTAIDKVKKTEDFRKIFPDVLMPPK